MNKKASMFLPENVLKLVIAVLAISILIVLAVKLGGIFIGKNDLAKASSALDDIIININSVFSSGKEFNYLYKTPFNWGLFYYAPELNRVDSFYPDICKNSICLCLCDLAYPKMTTDADCRNHGVCKQITNKLIIDFPYKLEFKKVSSLNIIKEGDKIKLTILK